MLKNRSSCIIYSVEGTSLAAAAQYFTVKGKFQILIHCYKTNSKETESSPIMYV